MCATGLRAGALRPPAPTRSITWPARRSCPTCGRDPSEALDAIATPTARLLELVRAVARRRGSWWPARARSSATRARPRSARRSPWRPTNPYGDRQAGRDSARAARCASTTACTSARRSSTTMSRRGGPSRFVSRKVTRAAAAIKLGLRPRVGAGLSRRGPRLELRRRRDAGGLDDARPRRARRLRDRQRPRADGARAGAVRLRLRRARPRRAPPTSTTSWSAPRRPRRRSATRPRRARCWAGRRR